MASRSDPSVEESEGETAPSPLRRLLTPRVALIVAVALSFGALLAATRYAPKVLLTHIVTLDAERLAQGYIAELADAFDLPGRPTETPLHRSWKASVLLGEAERPAPRFDLFDTARFTSPSTSQAVRGYVVLNRFGDRVLSAGRPLFRSLGTPEAAARFEAVRETGRSRIDRKGAMGATGTIGDTGATGAMRDTGTMTISVTAPLRKRGEFAGVVAIDVQRNSIEPGILAGIERSVFALVALVLCIALVLIVFLSLLRVQSARARRRADYLAQFDPLTGLHNREAFGRKLSERVREGHERKRHFASVLIDIDRFGRLNEAFGDAVGDAILVGFAKRIDERLRTDPGFAQCGAVAARLGADEFAALFSCDTRAHLERVCRALAGICEEGLVVRGIRIDLRASFGAALFPFDGSDADALQGSVRYALDVAKGERGDAPASVRVFDTEVAARHKRRRKLLQDIEGALAAGQMKLHYQPQVTVGAQSGAELTGFEALLRWEHPEEGAVSPAEFIPLAEQSGTIREIGLWCLHEGCKEAARWGAQGPDIAINVSPAQFVADMPEQDGLVRNVATALAESGLEPARLELEITEGLLLGDADEILSGLDALGVRLALDDFGTGYSSLSYLSRIAVDKVKIDRSFVLRMIEDGKVRAIVQAVVSMCEGMGMRVLAEGVETEAEQAVLVKLGCREIQGYLYGRPSPDPTSIVAQYRDEKLAA